MSTQTTQPLSLLHVDFDDLYARHLGRHSQFGINVGHLACSLRTLVWRLRGRIPGSRSFWAFRHRGWSSWPWPSPISPWSPSTPLTTSALRRRSSWRSSSQVSSLCRCYRPGRSRRSSLMVPVFYKVQAWNHKIWNVAADMTEFNRRFPPGRTLTTILLIYEVPICLNYLLFKRQDWRR